LSLQVARQVDFLQVAAAVLAVFALQQILRCLVVQQLRSQLAQVVLARADKATTVMIQYFQRSLQQAVVVVQVMVAQVIQAVQVAAAAA
jgi:hypothetical protein